MACGLTHSSCAPLTSQLSLPEHSSVSLPLKKEFSWGTMNQLLTREGFRVLPVTLAVNPSSAHQSHAESPRLPPSSLPGLLGDNQVKGSNLTLFKCQELNSHTTAHPPMGLCSLCASVATLFRWCCCPLNEQQTSTAPAKPTFVKFHKDFLYP